ncbi:MAG TPA: 50S ribosomal protein L15e, partial [Candidatus Thermoplasmatota archaeon]|nr:50S ribosomal protein L15e [Candidatus Thermoplasmatota archaeon]
MAKSLYSYIADAWKTYRDADHLAIRQQRLYQWRRESVFTRVERPTRLDRARNLGYKAKQGYVVVRTRVRRGSLRKVRFKMGAKPSGMGVRKITASKSIQRIAEERVQKHYPNMEVLNSYWVGEDGRHKYYEVILVDPAHPVILSDPKIRWIANPGNTNRVFRGKTSAGQRGRGLHHKG